jgi:hypothetical protein
MDAAAKDGKTSFFVDILGQKGYRKAKPDPTSAAAGSDPDE